MTNGEHKKPVESRTEETEVYRAWFDDPQGHRRYVDIPRFKGISCLRDGFWVTAEWEYKLGANALGSHWIPPSRIVIATKLDLEKSHE